VRNLADSGLFIALLDGTDSFHAWALDVIDTVEPPFFTCEAVCAETAAVLGTANPILLMIERADVVVDFNLQAETNAVRKLIRKYADQPMDLADACLVRMTELDPDSRIFTVDRRDFRIYRRDGRRPVPCIFPPE
jgi:predicted nucleic acid-binding protein